MIGSILNDRYLIEKEIGRGGIGIVYLARDQQLLSKPVVVKVLQEASSRSPWLKKKFRQEIEALARIDHPGVVGILDAGEISAGRPYLVMQYVDGQALRSIISTQGVTLDRVARIIRQASHALSAAHDKGVYHRDLKPENIMVQSLGENEEFVKIIDFGIATVKAPDLDSTQSSTSIAGSLVYMAPEQLKGNPVAASDTYALGVIAYEMLTGRRPFESGNAVRLYEMQRSSVPIRPKEFVPHLPAHAEEAILRALSFEANDRHARARDFGEELAQALSDFGGLSQHPSLRLREPNLGYLVSKMCNRHRQLSEFTDFFVSNLKLHPGMPQIYLLRGEERECHDSLVERIAGTQIRIAAEKMWGKHRGVVVLKRLGWAYQGELAALQLELKRMLFSEFDPEYIEDDLSVPALCNLASSLLSPFVVMQHRIHAGRWDRLAGPLVAWYIEYLSTIGTLRDKPQFVIFLSVIYPSAQEPWWKKWLPAGAADRTQISTQLRRILADQGAKIPCLMLGELLPLRQEDVKDWLSVNNIHPEKVQFELLEQIFKTERGHLAESKHMVDVEHELGVLLESINGSFLSTRSYA
jgi:serine/threonine protein kinase